MSGNLVRARGCPLWTEEQRAGHAACGKRYPSDLIEREGALIVPFIAPPRSGGRMRETDMREVMNAILKLLATGCQWRAVPSARIIFEDRPELDTLIGI